jgi:hypothetical protein
LATVNPSATIVRHPEVPNLIFAIVKLPRAGSTGPNFILPYSAPRGKFFGPLCGGESRLSAGGLHLAGMNDLQMNVTEKIRLIQRQNMGQTIGLHDRNKARIVYLNATHLMFNHQPAPYRIDFPIVGQKRHCAFNSVDAPAGVGDGEAIAVSFQGPGTDVPELSYILQRETSFNSTPVQLIESCPCQVVLGIAGPKYPQ